MGHREPSLDCDLSFVLIENHHQTVTLVSVLIKNHHQTGTLVSVLIGTIITLTIAVSIDNHHQTVTFSFGFHREPSSDYDLSFGSHREP